MEITRKSFITVAAAAVAALAAGELRADDPGTAEEGPTYLRGAVGQTFWAQGAGGLLIPIELVRSADVRSDERSEQYSLYFSPDPHYALTQGTWTLVSSSGRRVRDVFLVPAGTTPGGDRLYRADFCLLKGAIPPPPKR